MLGAEAKAEDPLQSSAQETRLRAASQLFTNNRIYARLPLAHLLLRDLTARNTFQTLNPTLGRRHWLEELQPSELEF